MQHLPSPYLEAELLLSKFLADSHDVDNVRTLPTAFAVQEVARVVPNNVNEIRCQYKFCVMETCVIKTLRDHMLFKVPSFTSPSTYSLHATSPRPNFSFPLSYSLRRPNFSPTLTR